MLTTSRCGQGNVFVVSVCVSVCVFGLQRLKSCHTKISFFGRVVDIDHITKQSRVQDFPEWGHRPHRWHQGPTRRLYGNLVEWVCQNRKIFNISVWPMYLINLNLVKSVRICKVSLILIKCPNIIKFQQYFFCFILLFVFFTWLTLQTQSVPKP